VAVENVLKNCTA